MNRKHLKFSISAILLMLFVLYGGMTSSMAQQQGKKTISGKVVDESNGPLPGVSIVVVGSTAKTITDFDGNYTLAIPEGSKELRFSFIGFEAQTLPVSEGNTLDVKLNSETQELADVLVVN
jgi:iron complex outermembrane receptor protein